MHVAVVGAGLMGRGIGQTFATGGHRVTLVDLDKQILKQALEQVKLSLSQMATERLLKEPTKTIVNRISLEVDVKKAVTNAQFVEEAIFENLDAKKKLFAKLDAASSFDCILATNTSSLPITSIASSTEKPGRVVGVHFWNPAHLMQAVEVVRGDKTDRKTVEKTVRILRSIGKKPAVVQKDVPGQIGIRILYAMIREATWLVENGIATPEDVDSVVREALGTRLEVVGPLELADLSGVDLVDAVAKGLYKSLDSSRAPQRLLKDMVARGEIGAKSGKGFYDWNKSGNNLKEKIKVRDEHLMKILRERRKKEQNLS